MSEDIEVVVDQLTAISNTLADFALVRLRSASESMRAGETPDPAVVAEEKRITRARRAVDKATQLLGKPSAAAGLAEIDGP